MSRCVFGRADALVCFCVVVLAFGCGGDGANGPTTHPSPGSDAPADTATPLDSVLPLSLETYDGSGQSVHPDYLRLPAGAPARGEFLALTPYPSGNSAYENPVVYQSRGRGVWTVPVPSLNPLVTPERGYLSDPDLVYDPDAREVRLYYREVDTTNEILLIRSRDMSTWSAPEHVVQAPNHEVVSPSVVRRSATDWLMWSVNTGPGCGGTPTSVELRRSTDGVAWSDPQPVSLSQGEYMPWHIEVQWIPSRNEYWAVYNGKNSESCATPALFFATSDDGVHWTTFPSPLLARGAAPQFRDIVYRSTFSYDVGSGIVTFWYSGARYDGQRYVWSTATQRRALNAVFTSIEQPLGSRGTAALRAWVPALRDPP